MWLSECFSEHSFGRLCQRSWSRSMPIFLKNHHTDFHSAVWICTPRVISYFIVISHSDKYKIKLKVVLVFIYLIDKNVEDFFKGFTTIWVSYFENSLFRSCISILKLGYLIIDMDFWTLYIFWIFILVKTLFYSPGCCFIWKAVSFVVQKHLSFVRSSLLTVSHSNCANWLCSLDRKICKRFIYVCSILSS